MSVGTSNKQAFQVDPTTQAAFVKALTATPFIAAIITVVAFAAPDGSLAHWGTGNESHPVVPALVNLGITWILAALAIRFFGHLTAERVNPASYHSLHTRLIDLEASHNQLCRNPDTSAMGKTPCTKPNPTCAMQKPLCAVDRYLASVRDELQQQGPRWVLGSGYSSAWERLHRAEEALITLSSNQDVWTGAWMDQLRTKGSKITNAKDLRSELDKVICTLGSQATGKKRQLTACEAKKIASHIRQEINEFRDRQWAQLLRRRGELTAATTFTAFTVYILLWTAIFRGAPQGTIQNGVTYFLIGAVVGLFNHIYIEANSSVGDTIDDYGASHARLFVTVLLSGLAALGGVVITAIFALTQTGQVGAQDSPTTVLTDFLSIQEHPLNIIVALTFGLSPIILIERLKKQADEYKSAIRTSKAAHREVAMEGMTS